MVKHTQTICWQKTTNSLSACLIWSFYGVGALKLNDGIHSKIIVQILEKMGIVFSN